MPSRSDRPDQFYPNDHPKYAERSLNHALSEGSIVAADERIIREYVREMGVTRRLSVGRQNKTTYTLVRWRLFIPSPYLDITYGDVLEGVDNMKRGKNKNGAPFKTNTQHDYLRILKQFLLWMVENEKCIIPEKKIKSIKVPRVDYNTTEPDDILTYDEIMKLLQACKSARDRALISTLYESGARIGEIARLQWRDLHVDKYGIKMYIRDQKTDQRRYARLVKLSPPYLAQWKEQYQGETGFVPDGDSIVFMTQQNHPLEYQTVSAVLKRVTERAGLTKRVHAHLFRKTRITHMVSEGFQESIVKEIMWKNPNTDMWRTYLKLSEKDIDDEILDKSGIVKKDEPKERMPEKVMCPNCFKENGPTNQYCYNCGMALSREAKEQVDKGFLDRLSSQGYIKSNI